VSEYDLRDLMAQEVAHAPAGNVDADLRRGRRRLLWRQVAVSGATGLGVAALALGVTSVLSGQGPGAAPGPAGGERTGYTMADADQAAAQLNRVVSAVAPSHVPGFDDYVDGTDYAQSASSNDGNQIASLSVQYTWREGDGQGGLDVTVESADTDSPPSLRRCSLPNVVFSSCREESTTTGDPILVGVGERDGTAAYLIRTRNDRGEFVTVAFTAQDGPSTTSDPPAPAIEDPEVSVNELVALSRDPALTLP